MTVVTGQDLGVQAWVGRADNGLPRPDAFNPPTMLTDHPRAKPHKSGMWTSTYHPRHGSGWVQWCIDEQFDHGPSGEFPLHLLTPDPAARVFEIDSLADLHELCAMHPHRIDYPDRGHGAWYSLFPHWERVASEFDAVHLTDSGQWATRLTHPLSLYGWDCESTLWLRFAFVACVDLGPVRFERAEDDELVLAGEYGPEATR